MQESPEELLREGVSVTGESEMMDLQMASRRKRCLGEDFRKQLVLGAFE